MADSHQPIPAISRLLTTPSDPITESYRVWMEADGDLWAKINVGGVTKSVKLIDYATGSLWVTDFSLEAALGNVPGYGSLNKFGVSINCDNGIATDIWDGADGVTGSAVWAPPTQARIHNLASTSAADTSAGTGMRTCQVYGLKTWALAETSEIVTLNGTSNVPTTQSYVAIHRIKGLTYGSGGTNAGIITATAVTDATVTAAIRVGKGQTLMAIYAIPSTQKISLERGWARVLRTGPAAEVSGQLLVRERADQSDSGFNVKEEFAFNTDNPWGPDWDPPKTFSGPCVVKVQVTSDTNNTVVPAGFDGYVVDG